MAEQLRQGSADTALCQVAESESPRHRPERGLRRMTTRPKVAIWKSILVHVLFITYLMMPALYYFLR